MTTAAAIDIQATASDSPTKKPYLHVERRHWLNALIFLLCMSMMGLQFPPAYLFVPVILIRSLIKDRYDAAIQLTISLADMPLSVKRPCQSRLKTLCYFSP